MVAKAKRVPVTMRALIQRINRALREDEQVLRSTRKHNRRDRTNLGNWILVDVGIGSVADWKVDPEALGRKLGVLHPWEEVADE